LKASSPPDFGKLIADETEKWGKVVKFASMKPDWFWGTTGLLIPENVLPVTFAEVSITDTLLPTEAGTYMKGPTRACASSASSGTEASSACWDRRSPDDPRRARSRLDEAEHALTRKHDPRPFNLASSNMSCFADERQLPW
jgi:hypothetical protein